MERKTICVAVDGPAGAGKSSAARLAAQRLGFVYADTGAIYRCVALSALRAGIDPDCAPEIEALLPQTQISIQWLGGEQHMFLAGEDVSALIRTPEVSSAASRVSAQLAVRDYLMQMQRDIASSHDVIMDGRDIGTFVLPDAPVKIFLTASPEARALRRMRELREKGLERTLESVLLEMQERDARDETREVRPLRRAADAVLLDSSDLTLEQTVSRMVEIIRKKVCL